MTFCQKNKKISLLSQKISNYGIFVSQIYDYGLIDSFWGSAGLIDSPASYATLLETMNYNYYLVDILHICDHTDPSQQDLTPHDGRDQLYAAPWDSARGQHQLSMLISCFVVSEIPTANPQSMHCLKQLTWKNQQSMSSLRCRRWLTLEIWGQRYQHRPVLTDIY